MWPALHRRRSPGRPALFESAQSQDAWSLHRLGNSTLPIIRYLPNLPNLPWIGWQVKQVARENDTADMRRVLLALIARMAAAGVRPSDSDEVRLYKATLSLTTGLISLAGVVWAGMYAALGLYRAAVIPLAYAVLSAITLPLAIATDRFDLFRTGQLGMMAI